MSAAYRFDSLFFDVGEVGHNQEYSGYAGSIPGK